MWIMENGSATEKWSFHILFLFFFYLCLNIKIHNDINITLDNIETVCTECPASVFETLPDTSFKVLDEICLSD